MPISGNNIQSLEEITLLIEFILFFQWGICAVCEQKREELVIFLYAFSPLFSYRFLSSGPSLTLLPLP